MENREILMPQGISMRFDDLRKDNPRKTKGNWLEEVPEKEEDFISISNVINKDEQ